jgi:hypothetical protein
MLAKGICPTRGLADFRVAIGSEATTTRTEPAVSLWTLRRKGV